VKRNIKRRECVDVEKIQDGVIDLLIEYLRSCKSRCAFFTSSKLAKMYADKYGCDNVKLISTIVKNMLVYLCDNNAIRLVGKCSRGTMYIACKNDLELIKRLIQDFD